MAEILLNKFTLISDLKYIRSKLNINPGSRFFEVEAIDHIDSFIRTIRKIPEHVCYPTGVKEKVNGS